MKNNLKILVVEDNPELLDIALRALKKPNFTLFSAINGAECIQSIQNVKPDIILLDLILPDANGKDLAKEIKRDPAYSSIYIILISSILTQSEHVAEGLEEGADSYIVRPIRNRELLARVEAVTRIVQAERDIKAAFEINWEVTFNGISDAIFLLDKKGIIVQANKQANVLFGQMDKELPGMLYSDIVPFQSEHINDDPFSKVILSKKRESIQLPVGAKWFNIVVDPLLDKENQFVGAVYIMNDISACKQYERELIFAKEKAEESDRLKSAFLENISHEIRTPLNGIMGFTEVLRKPDLSSEQKERYICMVQRSGQRMLDTMNDIVEITRIETGIIELFIKEFEVKESLNKIIRSCIPEATQKGLKLTLDKAMSIKNSVISTDEDKIDAILSYLIKNAIKYTQVGEIKVGMLEKDNTMEFYIEDTGIGIPEHRQHAIFQKFVKADIEDKDARQGSGLGLAITKAYVEMLGGKIWVESKLGEGSTFYFSLPLANMA